MSAHHTLKVHPQFWDGIFNGLKNFEIRVNDRKFKEGDHLTLRYWDPTSGTYGDTVERVVTFVLHHEDFPLGLQRGYVCLGLRPPYRA